MDGSSTYSSSLFCGLVFFAMFSMLPYANAASNPLSQMVWFVGKQTRQSDNCKLAARGVELIWTVIQFIYTV